MARKPADATEAPSFFSPSDIAAEAARGQDIRNDPSSLMPVSTPALPSWGSPITPDDKDRLLSAFLAMGNASRSANQAAGLGDPLTAALAGFSGAASGVAANSPDRIAAQRAEQARQAQLAQLSTMPVDSFSPDLVKAHPELKGLPLAVINQIAPIIERANQFQDSHYNLDQAASLMSPDQSPASVAATRSQLQKLYPNGAVPKDFAHVSATNNRFSQGQGLKLNQEDQKRLDSMGKDLDPSQQRQGAFGVSKQVFDRAERLQSMAAAALGNPNSRQMEELAIGINAMLSGTNTGASEQVRALVPQSLVGNASKFTEWLTNNPTGTNQQAFVKQLMDTVAREKATAADQIRRTQLQRAAAKYSDLEQKNPTAFYTKLQSYGIQPEDYQSWRAGGYKPLSAVQSPDSGSGGPGADLVSAAAAELKRRGL